VSLVHQLLPINFNFISNNLRELFIICTNMVIIAGIFGIFWGIIIRVIRVYLRYFWIFLIEEGGVLLRSLKIFYNFIVYVNL